MTMPKLKFDFSRVIHKTTISGFILAFIVSFLIFETFSKKLWETREIIISDVISYYGYLPAAIIHNDLNLNFIYSDHKGVYWPVEAPNGGLVFKMTMGLSILYLPFFTMAHLEALIFGYEAYGFSMPYQKWIQLSGLFYFFLGLFYLRKTLKLFFNDITVSSTLLTLLFATNLYYFVTDLSPYSHSFNFTLIAAFTYYSIKWHEDKSFKKSLIIGVIGGLIVLARPVNILVFVFFALYDVKNFSDYKYRIKEVLIYKKQLLIIASISFLVILPQLIYWKIITDHFFYYSYTNATLGVERFFWTNPHILEGLFSYRKGWLVYSPVMIFSLIGFILLYKKQKKFFIPLVTLFVLFIYIIFSWWSWWYGGGYGMRPMIDIYPFLAIPFCAFVEYIITQKKIIYNALVALTFSFCIYLNFHQTNQYRVGLLHWESMTKEAYWILFLNNQLNDSDIKALSVGFKDPDFKKAMRGEDEYEFKPFYKK